MLPLVHLTVILNNSHQDRQMSVNSIHRITSDRTKRCLSSPVSWDTDKKKKKSHLKVNLSLQSGSIMYPRESFSFADALKHSHLLFPYSIM